MLAALRRADRLLVAVTIAWAACLLYLGLAPRLPSIGSVDGSDLSSWGHAVGTMVLAVLLFLLVATTGTLSRWSTAMVVAAAATLFGVAIEGLQALTGDRDPSVADALLDALGAVVAVTALSVRRFSLAAASRRATWATSVLVVVVVVGAVFFTPPASGTVDCPTEPVDHLEPAPADLTRPETRGRVGGAVARYDFRAGRGEVVADVSGVAPALDLQLVGSEVSWLEEQGLHFDGGAARSTEPATKIVEATARTGELTLETWVLSDDLSQGGPARIATISDGTEPEQVNVHLGEEAGALSVRLRATCGLFNWWTVPDVFTSTDELVHLALTFDGSVQRTYVDGEVVEAVRLEGRLGDWDPDYPLVVGNEATTDRPFQGDVVLLAIYDRALTASELARNLSAGPSAPREG